MPNLDPRYSEWLEGAVRTIFETKPVSIALCATLPDGNVLTSYYHCTVQDKAIFAHNINADAMMDTVRINIGMIKEALEEDGHA